MARHSLVVAVVTALLAVGCLAAGALAVVRAVQDSAERVTVTVTEEGTHRERRGGRRSRHWAQVRHVEVVAEDGTTGRLDSDDLAVGDTAEVWRRDGELSLADPSGVGLGEAVLAGGLAVTALALGAVGIGSARRATRLRRTDVESAPRILLALDRAKLAAEPDRRQPGRVLRLPLRVVESTDPRIPVDSTEDLVVSPQTAPIDLTTVVPDRWEGRVLHRGALMKVVALRTRPDDPWWVSDL